MNTDKRSKLSVVLLVLGFPIWAPLVLAGGILLLALFLVIGAVIFSLYAVEVSLGVSAAALIFGSLTVIIGLIPLASFLAMMGIGLFAGGLTVLLWEPLCMLPKAFRRLCVGTGKGIGEWFRRG